MDLVVIAQIITGLATLIVALVLVFQLKKQNQQLELQHKDAEIQVSMMGENVHERLYNFANYSDEFLKIKPLFEFFTCLDNGLQFETN